jgi:hypothetical protein
VTTIKTQVMKRFIFLLLMLAALLAAGFTPI